jgi:glycosyltransferase involved in cell wall biosynthesis
VPSPEELPGRNVIFVAGKDPTLEIGGGHSVYVRAHARAALAEGWMPQIFCVSGRSGVEETDFGVVRRARSAMPLAARPGCGSPRYLSLAPWHVPQLARAIERYAAESGSPAMIHGFGVWAAAGVTAGRRLRRKGKDVRVLASVYTTNAEESRAKMAGLRGAPIPFREAFRLRRERLWVRLFVERLERKAIRGADLLLVNYERLRRALEEVPGAAPCRVIPYASEGAFAAGAPPEAPCPLPPGDAPLVVSISRHDPRKGIDVLLNALALLRAAGTPFRAVLVGGGVLLDAHRALAGRLGLGPGVSVPGFVADAAPYLRAADVFVLPSLQEGSGSLAMLEAMQQGRAIAASRCDGIPEDVEDGISGVLAKVGDASDLAAAIGRLLGDAALRSRLGEAARRTFESRFSSPVLREALRGIYDETTTGPRTP